MEEHELGQFKRTLERILAGLKVPVRQREEIEVGNCADALEYVRDAAERDLAIRQLELESSRIRDLRAAIARVAEGTYGICLECESEIGTKRLNAVPWARYCISCQEMSDHCSRQPEACSPAGAVLPGS